MIPRAVRMRIRRNVRLGGGGGGGSGGGNVVRPARGGVTGGVRSMGGGTVVFAAKGVAAGGLSDVGGTRGGGGMGVVARN